MINPSQFRLLSLAFTLAVFCNECAAAEPQRKPLNILLLYADDWRHDTLGCTGNRVVKTPHLDEFAQEGVRFTHNYVTISIWGATSVNRTRSGDRQ